MVRLAMGANCHYERAAEYTGVAIAIAVAVTAGKTANAVAAQVAEQVMAPVTHPARSFYCASKLQHKEA